MNTEHSALRGALFFAWAFALRALTACAGDSQTNPGPSGGGGSGGSGGDPCDPPRIEDPLLEEALRSELGTITLESMATLTVLDVRGGVESLVGLECAPALEALTVRGTAVANLEPLAGLRNLVFLDVSGTEVRSLEPLSSVASLRTLLAGELAVASLEPLANVALDMLAVAGDPLESLEPLRSVTTLRILDVSRTGIDDLEPLAGISGLEQLTAADNPIADISAARSWAAVKHLSLVDADVVEIDPLLDVAWPLPVTILLAGNPLSAHATSDVLPQLCARGYTVSVTGMGCNEPDP